MRKFEAGEELAKIVGPLNATQSTRRDDRGPGEYQLDILVAAENAPPRSTELSRSPCGVAGTLTRRECSVMASASPC